MIGFLSGKPLPFTKDALILDVRGVGYKVFTPHNLLSKSKILSLFIHTHVRDDTLDLYGFSTKEELQLFELIISVSGIGPKIGLALMDKSVEAISAAVAKADVDFFTSVPRVGKKNAQKIIIDLKSKLGSLEELDLLEDNPETKQTVQALLSLGFTKKETHSALKNLDSSLPLEEKIRKAIKILGKNKG